MYQKLSVFPPFSISQTSSFGVKSGIVPFKASTLTEKIG